jgi:hypothetical protein
VPVPRRSLGSTVAALACVLSASLALAACSGPAAPTATPSAAPATALTIVYAADGAKPDDSISWTLTCDPVGGDHPDPAGACAALEANGKEAIPPVAEDRACTMIYGGPDTAKVTGNWNGQPVDATFNRSGGCEIDRWKSLEPLLPAVNG